MENRHGLCADFTLHNPIAEPEPVVALQQVDEHARTCISGVDGQNARRGQGVSPERILCKAAGSGRSRRMWRAKKREVAGLDGRTTTAGKAYQVSLKIRKRVEEIFGWMKTVGGLRRSRYRGRGTDAGLGLFRGGDLQFAADGAAGTGQGRLKRSAKADQNVTNEQKTNSGPPTRHIAGDSVGVMARRSDS